MPPVVGIEEGDPRTARPLDPQVPGARRTTVGWTPDQAHVEAAGYGHRIVWRGVIDNDDLAGRDGL